MYTIDWRPKARKQLAKIRERTDADAIRKAVGELAMFPNAKNVKALSNHEYGYRLRVGRYRVLFDANTGIQVIDIQEVKKRDERTY